MCVLKPAVYQKAKSHWLHLFHFPPCVLSNASSKLLHLRIHNYALQRFHSVTGLTIEIKTGLIFALGSNCNQFKYTPQVLKRLQLLPSFHCHNWHLGVYCSVVLATYGAKNIKFFVSLVRDELKLKYAGTRFQKYASCPIEASAQFWMRQEMGWTQSIPERLPT